MIVAAHKQRDGAITMAATIVAAAHTRAQRKKVLTSRFDVACNACGSQDGQAHNAPQTRQRDLSQNGYGPFVVVVVVVVA